MVKLMHIASPRQKARWAAEATKPLELTPEEQAHIEMVNKLDNERWNRELASRGSHKARDLP